MKPFNQVVDDGIPWIDYSEGTKTANSIRFVFNIQDFLNFVLREICIVYPCGPFGHENFLSASAQIVSSRNEYIPIPIPPPLFSSPSENFNQFAINELAQGQRKQPIIFNFPCDKGDTIIVTITGAPLAIVVGCMITGRRYGRSF